MMMLKSPNRSQRTKGLRTTRVFQAFLVIALCIWLLYEVKHWHDVKKEDTEGNKDVSEQGMPRETEAVRLGRKNLDPRGNELAEEEEEMVKQEDSEAEDTDQSVEDLIDEDDRENENEVEDSGNADLDDQVGDEEVRNSPDAWEESYKKDDVSGSAEH